MSTGRNFDEVLRVIDSMQLTAKHKVATPVNWKDGEDVIILPAVSDDEAKQKYPQGWKRTEAVPAHRPAAEVTRPLVSRLCRVSPERDSDGPRGPSEPSRRMARTQPRRRSHFPLPGQWPEKLTLKWKVDVGTGYAAPITVGDRVFAFSRQGEDEVMRALDAATGKTIWETKYNATVQGESGRHAHARHRDRSPRRRSRTAGSSRSA